MKYTRLIYIFSVLTLASACSTLTPDRANIESVKPTKAHIEKPKVTSYSNLIERVVAGYKLNAEFNNNQNKRFLSHQQWYTKNTEYLHRVLERSQPYLHFIVEEIEQRDLPLELALLPVIESAYRAEATSRSKAAGLWQFIPSTGRYMGLKQTWWADHRRDAIFSTHKALDYLTQLHKKFDGDWLLAIAAYNGGQGTIRKAIKRNKKQNKSTDFYSLKLSKETSNYVPKLLALASIVENAVHNNHQLPVIDNSPYFQEVKLKGQLDIFKLIKETELNKDEFYKLNASFNRWATSPDGPHRLVIPISKADNVSAYIDSLPTNLKIRWKKHHLQSGDTLYDLSRKYKVSISAIKSINNMRTSRLRAGKTILIPLRSSQKV